MKYLAEADNQYRRTKTAVANVDWLIECAREARDKGDEDMENHYLRMVFRINDFEEDEDEL